VALKALTLALLVVGVLQSSPANSQSLTTEADVTGGYSNDGVTAVATQLRGFGELKAGVRFYLEGTWATRSFSDADGESDAFSAAYPYDNRVQFTETFAERMFRPERVWSAFEPVATAHRSVFRDAVITLTPAFCGRR
jgi:hypothetical protein